MRFIFNFFLYGVLFYAIWFFFPDAFHKMVEWAGAVFTYLKDIIAQIIDKITQTSGSHAPQNPAAPAPGVSSLFFWWY